MGGKRTAEGEREGVKSSIHTVLEPKRILKVNVTPLKTLFKTLLKNRVLGERGVVSRKFT